jgi:hypothetical protein
VAQLKSGLGTGNFIVQGLTPQAVIGPEEATFRGTRAQVIPQDTQRLFSDIQGEVQRNPQGDASKYAPALRTIAVQLSQDVYDQGVLQQGEISPRLERLLANPTATNINEVQAEHPEGACCPQSDDGRLRAIGQQRRGPPEGAP